MAPELFDCAFTKFSRLPADVYALAILLFELLTCAVPWSGMPDGQIVMAVTRGLRPDLSSLDSGPLKQLVEQGWAQAMEDRPTTSAALEVSRIDLF